MLVKRIENGYQFESLTTDGAFIVRLTLLDSGKERLETCPVGGSVCFKARTLPIGTIERAVGPERWKNFQQMKKREISTMFIDPHYNGFIPHIW